MTSTGHRVSRACELSRHDEAGRPGVSGAARSLPFGQTDGTAVTQGSDDALTTITRSRDQSSSSSFFSTTRVSVVRTRPAIEAALRSAERVTLTGSMMPAATRSTYSPVAAFRP